jgi:phage terminase large subunit-like protein
MIEKQIFDKKTHPNCYDGHQYALDVVSGKLPNCVYVIGACKRYLNDLERFKDKELYYFDKDAAEKALRIFQKFEHVKGHWDPPQIVLEGWQKFLFMNVYGWMDVRTGMVKYRTIHAEVPRGNGKSLLASAACLYSAFCDNPNGDTVSCVATKKEQARIVLDAARHMAIKNKKFTKQKKIEVLAHNIVQKETFSEVKALSSDKNGLDGLNDKLAVCDELHAMSREVFELISSGMSKRSDSIILCITTAGFNVESVGHSQSAYAKKLSLGEVEDEQFFSLIYTLDKDDDIFDPKVWPKVNPNWGVSVDPITFEAKVNKAKVTPSDIPNLKVKHFNMWLSEADAFYSQAKWDECADKSLKIEDFLKQKCYVGLDLASKVDLTSFVSIFKKEIDDVWHYYIFDNTYIPAESIHNNVLYDNAEGAGHLIKTPGEAIHYPKIQDDLYSFSKKFKTSEVYFDPWNATEFAQRMISKRVNMVEFRMTTANLSEPTKILDALMRQKRIHHNGSMLLRWCIGNVICKEDPAGNVFPKKSHDKLKIDPVVSLIMALAGWITEEENRSVYETRGTRII